MKYLTVADVLLLHSLAIDLFGGTHGLDDLNLLESAIMRPQTTYEGKDLYNTIYDKDAAIVHSLLMNHAFIDGNKRTAMLAGMTFLERNGLLFTATQKEVVSYVLFIEHVQPEIESISTWLNVHTKNE